MNDTDVRAALDFGTATIHEAAGRIGALRSEIQAVAPSMRIAGPAFTVRTPPGDNLWIHRAVYSAKPGDVLVVATGDAHALWGYWGEILSIAAIERGLGGLVLEGGSRDHDQLEALGFPVFSLGACIRGTIKDLHLTGPWLNGGVEIGEVFVAPGDLVVGDADGVAVVPHSQVSDVIVAARQRVAKEQSMMDQLRAGRTTLELLGLSG
jgi:4-hydroxy-4-methyl-2-oxoglutarate aldolase